MERSPLIDQLEHNGEIIRTMMSGATPDFIRWRPALGKWSPLEVICHLHDEEREDLRTPAKCAGFTREALGQDRSARLGS